LNRIMEKKKVRQRGKARQTREIMSSVRGSESEVSRKKASNGRGKAKTKARRRGGKRRETGCRMFGRSRRGRKYSEPRATEDGPQGFKKGARTGQDASALTGSEPEVCLEKLNRKKERAESQGGDGEFMGSIHGKTVIAQPEKESTGELSRDNPA